MAKISIITPMITEYAITVSIPFASPLVIIMNQAIDQAISYFISLRDAENDLIRKNEYDRVRAFLRWAACCSASLEDINNPDQKLLIKLNFTNMSDMIEFQDYMVHYINDSITIK